MSFGQVALHAVDNIRTGKMTPEDGWNLAAQAVFTVGNTSIKKVCPKNAFLGLCEEGLIKDIPPGKYTRSDRNKLYAVKAVELLKTGKFDIRPASLWNQVLKNIGAEATKRHNSQMNVVLALWEAGLIIYVCPGSSL